MLVPLYSKKCNDILIGYVREMFMLELLLISAAALTYGLVSDKFKRKDEDKKKIQVFFEVSGIAIKKDDKLHYPKFQKQIDDDRSTTYIYTLPVGMPSKIIQKVEDVVSEGLNKPVPDSL